MITLAQLQRLAGVRNFKNSVNTEGSNISVTAAEKNALMKQHDIQPGTPEWFRLWFSLPYLTGEKPINDE